MDLKDIKIGQKLRIKYGVLKNSLSSNDMATFERLYPSSTGIVKKISGKEVYLMPIEPKDITWYFHLSELEKPENIFEKICKWENE